MKKTISFAIMHFIIAFSVAWALTGDIIIGGAVAVVEPAVNTVAFYWHEKFWLWRNAKTRATSDIVPPPQTMTFCC